MKTMLNEIFVFTWCKVEFNLHVYAKTKTSISVQYLFQSYNSIIMEDKI